jgi:hypothetical protein
MDSQPQEDPFKMEPCTPCDKNRLSHIETETEKRCSNKTELPPQTDMWNTVNRKTHIKIKNKPQTTLTWKKFDPLINMEGTEKIAIS